MKIFATRLAIFLLFCFSSTYAQEQTGKASFYADKFEGRPTASGEKYKHSASTAAHKTYPFGTQLKVTNLSNDKSVIVRVNDRGPFVKGRIIDLSKSAAQKLGFIQKGTTHVKVEVLNAEGTPAESIMPSPSPIGGLSEIESTVLYDLKFNKINRFGFGVQIGSYRELSNLTKAIEKLKPAYAKEAIIKTTLSDDDKTYALIISQYKSRDKAEGLLKKLQKSYPDSFIVEYSNTK